MSKNGYKSGINSEKPTPLKLSRKEKTAF